MDTWSSWLALVGVESILQGMARCLFSAISAAAVTSAIMNPEFSPGSGDRNAGRPKFCAGSTVIAIRRSVIEPISASARAHWSAAKATGSA